MFRSIRVITVALVASFTAMGFDHTHADWDRWLKKFTKVTGAVTTVDYATAKSKPEALRSYTQNIEAVTRAEFDRWTDPEKMAFLINTYNAFTVSLIADNYPVKSIKDLGGIFSSPWKKKFFRLFGEERHLDHVEHELLRKMWAEPRIHFAVNCASKGCPALRGEAFTAAKLEAQLESSAKLFLSDPSRNRWVAAENKLYLSKIFDWYGGDFVKKHGSVQAFVAPRMKASTGAAITYLDYDWTLNETPSRTNANQ